jgi:uncharacterized membrane protein
MILLVLGLAVFLGIHLLTAARGTRAVVMGRLGEGPYKGLYSLVATAGLVLVVWGFAHYRSTGYVQVWDPPAVLHPVALLLLWFAFVALAATYAPAGKIKATLRHPMLAGVKAWALAHLLVNGDLGALVLFGSFLAWAVFDRIAVKKRGDAGARPVAGPTRGDIIALGVGTLAYIAMYWLHPLLIGVPVM